MRIHYAGIEHTGRTCPAAHQTLKNFSSSMIAIKITFAMRLYKMWGLKRVQLHFLAVGPLVLKVVEESTTVSKWILLGLIVFWLFTGPYNDRNRIVSSPIAF